MRLGTVIAAITLTVASAGCADPYERPPDAASPPGQERAAPGRPSEGSSSRPAATPELAARRAGQLTGTWAARTFSVRQTLFAREAIGDARADAQLASARFHAERSPASASGRVVAITRVAQRTGSTDLVVLTREQLIDPQGQKRQRWRVIEATARRQARGWAISRWNPQP